jgi:hypothetical protein
LGALARLGLEDFEQGRQRLVVAGVAQAAHRLGGDGRQLEARQQLAHAGGHVRGEFGHDWPPASRRS